MDIRLPVDLKYHKDDSEGQQTANGLSSMLGHKVGKYAWNPLGTFGVVIV